MSVNYSFFAFVRPVLAGTVLLALGLASSCTYSQGDPVPACDVAKETVTYAAVISPIFDTHCRECHAASVYVVKGGGNNFDDYQAIKSYFSPTILLGTIRHAPGFDPMPKGRDKLSECDIQRIETWVAAGKLNN